MNQNLAAIAAETEESLRAGRYVDSHGFTVHIKRSLDSARQGTVCLSPTDPILSSMPKGQHNTVIKVVDATTLVAARELFLRGFNPVALNFASAKHPGGGFLRGADAQEEYLCRATGLYHCLKGQRMYQWHEANEGYLYSSWLIYSPGVPVLRDEHANFTPSPWSLAFITSPAPNVRAYREHGGTTPDALISNIVAYRAERILAMAMVKGHDSLVLGAWGCGVFGCDPGMVASVFRKLLTGPYKGIFREVAFAIPAGLNQECFSAVFAGA